jgi:hypothetical protein
MQTNGYQIQKSAFDGSISIGFSAFSAHILDFPLFWPVEKAKE